MRFYSPSRWHRYGYDMTGPRLARWQVSTVEKDGRTLHTFGTYAATRKEVEAAHPDAVMIQRTKRR